MNATQNGISTFFFWSKSFELLQLCAVQYTQIATFTMILPYLAGVLISGFKSMEAVTQLQSSAFENYSELIGPAAPFFLSYCCALTLITVSFIVGFLAMVSIGAAHNQNEGTTVLQALRTALKRFPKSLLFFLIIGALSLEASIVGPLRVLSLFALVGVIPLVRDNRGALSSLKQAILFRYVHPASVGAFGVAMVLIGFSALLFGFQIGLSSLTHLILHLDLFLGFSRDLWTYGLFSTSVSLPFLIAKGLEALGQGFILSLIASFIVTVYYYVSPKINYFP